MVDKITGRVKDWKAKFLNYAGRLELIKSVIHGILQYWLSMFMLPKAVLKEIEDICASFLEGGLGLKDLSSWNEANIVRHLWSLITRGGSLWVAWIQKYRLKNGDFWTLSAATGSWHWRNILKLRELVAPFITADGEGDYLWNGCYLQKFKVSKIWENIRPRRGVEDCSKYLWKGHRIMKNSFLTWLILRDRISTLDKIAKWNNAVVNICPLCSIAPESRDHLFAECAYFRSCTSRLFHSIQFSTWQDHIEYILVNWRVDSVENKARRIGWCATLSTIWRERCKRVYGTSMKSSDVVNEEIKLDLTLYFSGHRDELEAFRSLSF